MQEFVTGGILIGILSAGAAALEKLMKDFAAHHKTARAPAGWTPRTSEIVSAQFSEDDQW
jgi:staphylococcal nuclease domain-containing protein 1